MLPRRQKRFFLFFIFFRLRTRSPTANWYDDEIDWDTQNALDIDYPEKHDVCPRFVWCVAACNLPVFFIFFFSLTFGPPNIGLFLSYLFTSFRPASLPESLTFPDRFVFSRGSQLTALFLDHVSTRPRVLHSNSPCALGIRMNVHKYTDRTYFVCTGPRRSVGIFSDHFYYGPTAHVIHTRSQTWRGIIWRPWYT